ncbi:MAG TPA: amidohydrolase family protein [Burkholderiales bacterium]|nr:amidohydrolase family protein [Burkholderiales bacterium]
MRIIDFRVRPPLRGFLQTAMYANAERRDRFTRQLGLDPAPSASAKSTDLMFEEFDAAGIALGVVTARCSNMLGSTSNEDVAAIVARYPQRLVGIAAVDPTNRKAAIKQIDDALAAGFRGVNIEPGAYPQPLYADDRRLYPIYAHCEDRDVPVVVMTGGNAGPDLSYSFPVPLDRVAGDFPSLRIVISHGGWPWVSEVLHIAFRRPNVYLSPDMYLCNMPGMDDFIKAANGFLADRFIYASAYPLAPLKQYADWFLKLPLNAESMEKALFRNAARLLDLKL